MAEQKLAIDDELAPYFANWESGRPPSPAEAAFLAEQERQGVPPATVPNPKPGIMGATGGAPVIGPGETIPAPTPAPILQAPPVKPLAFQGKVPRAPASEPALAPAAAPAVRDYIAERLSKKDDELKTLQDQAAGDRRLAGVAEGVGQMVGGLSRSSQPFNPAGYQFLHENAGQPVKDYIQRQDTRGKAVQEASAEQKLEHDSRLQDPNSPESLAFKHTLQRLYPGKFKPEDLATLSAADKNLVFEPLKLEEQISARKQQAALMASFRDSQLGERQDFRAHQAVLGKLRGDKTLTDAANRAQNVQNAIANAEATGKITPQDFHDLQQLVVANTGMGGGGGVGERMERYAKSMGVNAADLLQTLSGSPQDIGKDHPMYQRYKQLGNLEVGNFRARAKNRLKALTSGNESIYSRRPDLKSDLDSAVAAQIGQLPAEEANGAPGRPAPGSIINVKGKRFRVGADGDTLEAI